MELKELLQQMVSAGASDVFVSGRRVLDDGVVAS